MDNCIIVFAKAPVPGNVKTRMIPAVGRGGAVKLQKNLTEKTMSVLKDFPVVIYSDREDLFISRLAEKYGVEIRLQQGEDLGERMRNAIKAELQNSKKVLLVGIDCPEHTRKDIEAAFERLDDHEAVFIPAVDGGYVLVGVKEDIPEIFSDISWSTSVVMEQTLQKIGQRKVFLLPPKHDIDNPDDLEFVPRRFY